MAFDWMDYLTLAKELAKRTDEAAQRSAISRAYYAAFGKACHLLHKEGVSIPRQDMHQFVWSQFQDAPDSNRQQIGIDGDRLKRIRRNADYDPLFPLLPSMLPSAIARAEDLIKSLARLQP